MTSIHEILAAKDVNLALASTEQAGAVEEVLGQLRGDARVLEWDVLREVVFERAAPDVVQDGVGICIAHGRTHAVSELVLAAGRSALGVKSTQIVEPVRLIFVAGIPLALSSEYLRIIGAIVRICRDSQQLMRLLSVKDPFEFIRILSEAEIAL